MLIYVNVNVTTNPFTALIYESFNEWIPQAFVEDTYPIYQISFEEVYGKIEISKYVGTLSTTWVFERTLIFVSVWKFTTLKYFVSL